MENDLKDDRVELLVAVRNFTRYVFIEPFQPKTPQDAWHRKIFGVALLYGFIAFLYFGEFHTPSPGKAVAAMAVAAAVVTFRGEIAGKEKIAWSALFLAFLLMEMNSIDQDHRENREAQTRQQESFERVLDKNREIQKLTETSLLNITGGNSYAVVLPQLPLHGYKLLPLQIENRGPYLLTGVIVTIERPVSFSDVHEEITKSEKRRKPLVVCSFTRMTTLPWKVCAPRPSVTTTIDFSAKT